MQVLNATKRDIGRMSAFVPCGARRCQRMLRALRLQPLHQETPMLLRIVERSAPIYVFAAALTWSAFLNGQGPWPSTPRFGA